MWSGRSLLPTAVIAGLASVGLGALACTPLGGWLYSDPTFALSGVTTKYRGAPADTLQFVLTGCNLHDFNLDGLTIEARLLVDGVPVGNLWVEKAFLLKLRDSVEVLVPVEMPRTDGPPLHAKGDDLMTAAYELNGRVEVSTPIGIRQVALRQHGEVRFDSAGLSSGWTVRNARPCRPGQSIIPGQSIKPRILVDTMFRPMTPTGPPAGRVDP